SWRGVGFVMDVGQTTTGRRIAIHEYPYRDSIWAEDLGKLPRRFSFQAFLTGDDVYQFNGRLLIKGCSIAGRRQQAHWQGGLWDTNTGGSRTAIMGFGDWAGDTNPTTALRLLLNSGNIADGRVSPYAITTG